MSMSYVPWLRMLADKGGKGVVNNIDARCLGRIADRLEELEEYYRTGDPVLLPRPDQETIS